MVVQFLLKEKIWKVISKKLKVAENKGNDLDNSGTPATEKPQSIPEAVVFSSSPVSTEAEDAGNIVATDFSPLESLPRLDPMPLDAVFATPPEPAVVPLPIPASQPVVVYAEESPQINGWHFLGEGTLGYIINDEGSEVLKIPKTMNHADAPERSVRLLNAINPELPPARQVDIPQGTAWICPFIAGEQASDRSAAIVSLVLRAGVL